jgi:hypothetical protein
MAGVILAEDPVRLGVLLMATPVIRDQASSGAVRRELARLRQAAVTALRERFERAVRDGDLPGGTDCATLARYVATVLHGLAVQAASGATETELRLVAALAMRAWPC